ncbi:MAG: hypothetical protein H6R26_1488 [Proteobacteria bacterium]|nr:hypothetical protein [Pseudomonadota bacterium]
MYLCAAWSIADDKDPTKEAILGIAEDEMSHVGLACNMLKAIGGAPDLTSPAAVPSYPGHLPGGLHPDLVVSLRRLAPSALDVFMAIEHPAQPVVNGTALNDTASPTIAEYYQTIWTTFRRLAPMLDSSGQVEGPLGLFAMRSLEDIERAIHQIIDQGQGTPSTFGAGAPSAPGHYYRFAELYHGARLIQDAEGVWGFFGEVVPFPAVFPMADIPPGGYQPHDVPAAIWEKIAAFDRAYSVMLKNLEAAWHGVTPSPIGKSIAWMKEMADIGESLIAKPIDAQNPALGNYGPCFRRIS